MKIPKHERLIRIKSGQFASDDDSKHGAFHLGELFIMSSGELSSWQHVSVSRQDNRTPTWEEMALVKSIFWDDEETVVQFHPKKSLYVNKHPGCLHLWKKAGDEFELPPIWMV